MRKVRFGLVGLVFGVLTGCMSVSNEPAGPVYDVRSALAVSGGNIAPELLSGIGDRVNAAINATVRNEVYPRVVLTIRVTTVAKKQGIEKNRNVAHVSVDAASVDDGAVVAVTSFVVTSVAYDEKSADQILAEDIAARVRAIFGLNNPRR